MSSVSLTPGMVFAARYQVVRCIATGGMGAVYEVVHTETGRHNALKVMHPHILGSQELRERFRKEARVAANIQSEFIVDVFDAGVDAQTDMPYLVMELLQGEELGVLLDKRGRLPAREVFTYLQQVAFALDKTHRAMIVHRDLKPENLFLTYRDDGTPRVKVLDFGIAKVVAETNTNAAATRSVGTPLYMSPEQFRAGKNVAPATDLYALALIAYTLLVGEAYWSEDANNSDNVFAFASVAMAGPVESACARAARRGVTLPLAFDPWFARGANVNPALRFPSATHMIRDLGVALGLSAPGSATLPSAGAGGAAVESTGPHLAISGSSPAISMPPAAPPQVSVVAAPPLAPAGPMSGGPMSGGFAGTAALPPSVTLQSPGPGRPAMPSGIDVTGGGTALQQSTPSLDLTPPKAKSKAPIFAGAAFVAVAVAVGGFLGLQSATGAGADAGETPTLGASQSATAPVPDPSAPPALTAPPIADPAPTTTASATAEPTAAPTTSATAAPTAEPSGAKPARPTPSPKPTGKTPAPKSSVYIRD